MRALLRTPADRARTVVIDLETTGLHPGDGDRVIEIAAVVSTPDGIEELSALVDPGIPIPIDGIAIHGIDDGMVHGQPLFDDVWPRFAPLLPDSVLVGHNVAFDLAFIEMECDRAGLPPPRPAVVIDTLDLARNVFGLVHCSLQAVAERIGIDHAAAHRALPDARATFAVYRAMLGAIRPPGIPTVGQLQRLVDSLSRGGNGRSHIRRALRAAMQRGQNVVIDYTSGAGGALTTRREITITRIRPPYLEAHCHLRNAPRVFKLNRIRRVMQAPSSTEDVTDAFNAPPSITLDDTPSGPDDT
ncbi:MAG: hypothetical protein D6798_16960 [Deltaproteobacteria bacterium]|nr:MAG: hypothetical protein D6798_16960 [Deltaproteobacteria bacterium]